MSLIKNITILLVFTLSIHTNAQTVSTTTFSVIPDSVKQICKNLFVSEIGKRSFNDHIKFEKAEGIKRVYQTNETRLDYTLHYTFSYPGVRGATFPIEINYSVYSGKGHLQSSRFLRPDRTDLPYNFKELSTTIIDYDQAKSIAYKTDPKIKAPKGEEKDHFVLFDDSFYWVFKTFVPQITASSDGENMKEHTIVVDPYSGKIKADYTR